MVCREIEKYESKNKGGIKMENKPFESILNYLKDENVISKKEFDYLNNDEVAAKNTILYYYNNVDDPNVNMLVELNWDYFLELEEE